MFRSFYLAGFECATGSNMHGEWIDQIAATEHDLHVDEDYERLAKVAIQAVREAIRWPLVDRAGRYDFSSVEPFVRAAARHRFDVIWDLFHYGYPNDLDPFTDRFISRFAAYCQAAARFIARHSEGVCYFTPINEPSYFAWAAGEVGLFAPHVRGRGTELKVALARAAISGIAAIRAAVPHARIVNVDPICRVVPGSNDPEALERSRHFNEVAVFEFWDIVCGRNMPELGGSPRTLDIVGLNYYWTNQWELGREGVPLADDDPRRVPLTALVREAHRRYRTDVVITETSALGDSRAPWIHELSSMATELLAEGVALRGVCLYPILGMPEWHAQDQWTRMGLWDLEREQDVLQRKACMPMLEALQTVQQGSDCPEIVRERSFSLGRTGQPFFNLLGHCVWQRVRAGGQSLSIFRSDRPYRLWVAVVTLSTAVRTVEYIRTAAELPLLLDILAWLPPSKAANHYRISAHVADINADALWRSDLDEVRQKFEYFEAICVLPGREPAKPYPVPGGGRQ
jgi:hypothetical protein